MGAPKWHLKCEMKALCLSSHQEPISPSLDSVLDLWLVRMIGCGEMTLYGFWALALREKPHSFLYQRPGMLPLCEQAQAGPLESERVHGESSHTEREGQALKLRPQSCKWGHLGPGSCSWQANWTKTYEHAQLTLRGEERTCSSWALPNCQAKESWANT